MLREVQIDIRRQRAKAVKFQIENLGKNRVFSDYRITNPESGGQYTVSVKGFETGDNACTCPDFKANTLGTCKHIEAVLDHLKDELPPNLQKKKAAVTRPEIFLHYGEQLQLGIHLPPRHSDKLAKLATHFFDDKGLWSGRGFGQQYVFAVYRRLGRSPFAPGASCGTAFLQPRPGDETGRACRSRRGGFSSVGCRAPLDRKRRQDRHRLRRSTGLYCQPLRATVLW